LYVVVQLLGVAAKDKRPDILAYGLLLGLLAGFLTDAEVHSLPLGLPLVGSDNGNALSSTTFGAKTYTHT